MYFATYRDAQGAALVGKDASLKAAIAIVQGTCGYVTDESGRQVWPVWEEEK